MLADAVQGAKRPSQLITWIDQDGNPVNLAGAIITARLLHKYTSQSRDSDGVFEVTDAEAGKFRWDYGDTDVSEAGKFDVQFTAVFGSDPTPARTLLSTWQVHRAI